MLDLSRAFDPDRAEAHGWTPLHMSAFLRKQQCIRELLDEGGAHVNPKTTRAWLRVPAGSTPLDALRVTGAQDRPVLMELLSHGARPGEELP